MHVYIRKVKRYVDNNNDSNNDYKNIKVHIFMVQKRATEIGFTWEISKTNVPGNEDKKICDEEMEKKSSDVD